MKYRILGKTGLKVSEIGFGAWAIGGNKYGNSYGNTDDAESLKSLTYAFDHGCNFFDTADLYGYGHSEKLIGNLVSQINRSEIVIATKVGANFYSGGVKMDFSPEYIKKAVDQSLLRLNTDYIDLYQLHNPSLEIIKDGEVFEVMRELKKLGKIRAFGVSIDESIEGIEAIKWAGVDTVQLVYNILDPEAKDEFFEQAELAKIGLIIREPLANGLLTGKYNENSYFPFGDIRHSWPVSFIIHRTNSAKQIKKLLSDEVDTLTKFSLKFASNPLCVGTVIPGCKNLEQTIENILAGDIRQLNQHEINLSMNMQSRRFDTY